MSVILNCSISLSSEKFLYWVKISSTDLSAYCIRAYAFGVHLHCEK
jgi:hypothetical protein